MKQYLKQYPGQVAVALALIVAVAFGVHIDPFSLALAGGVLATEAIKSGSITNATATPRVMNPAYLDGGRVRIKREVVTAGIAIPDVGSTYRFFRVKSNDVVTRMEIDADSFGTGTTWDIGVYRVDPSDGSITVRDADFFASAVSMAAAQRGTDVLRESLVVGIVDMGKRLWEQLGYTQDPQCDFEVVATVAAQSITGTVAGSDACITAHVVGGH